MMKMTLAVMLTLLVTPSAAHADWDLKALTVMLAGQSADVVSTYHIINTPRLHCHEVNGVMGSHPSLGKLVGTKAVSVGVATLLMAVTHNSPHKFNRWVGKSAAYFNGGLGGYMAVGNVARCGW